MSEAHRARAAEFDRLGIKHVPCETCGCPTDKTSTERCDGCWEVEHRIGGDLREGGAKARDFLVGAIGEAVRDAPASFLKYEGGHLWVAQCFCGPVWGLDETGRFTEHPRYAYPSEPAWRRGFERVLTRCEGSGQLVPEGSRVKERSPEATALIERVYGLRSETPLAEREATLVFLRAEADRHRSVANDMRVKCADADARAWLKIAEALGNIANRIQRLEHRE
jgi:hypothetical protein